MLLDLLAYCKLPVFVVNPAQVDVLKTPQSFHETLLESIRRARRRIVLSTLYIGTGALEMELVNTLEEAVRNNKVKLTILMDATRGTRPTNITHHFAGISDLGLSTDSSTNMLGPNVNSSCSLLCSLAAMDGVSVLLYREPVLQRWIHYFLPKRWNEIFGLQHIKSYVFDDSVILSGANLSHEYFTSRQDRAWYFKDAPALADFYSKLVHLIGDFCYRLNPNGSLTSASSSVTSASIADSCVEYTMYFVFHTFLRPLANVTAFRERFRIRLNEFLHSETMKHPFPDSYITRTGLTLLVPLVQFGSYNVREEERFTTNLFTYLSKDDSCSYRLSLASGYFNLTDSYQNFLHQLIDTKAELNVDVLCAAPTANGFLNSKGVSGYIPMAYREALLIFLQGLKNSKSSHHTQVLEYSRPKWTFHAKGLWLEETAPNQSKSILSLIGSSNFSYRSLNRDLESQLVVYTNDNELRRQISEEKSFIFSPLYSRPITIETILAQSHFRLPWYTRFFLPFFRLYM